MSIKVSLVIPCYNESQNLSKLLELCNQFLLPKNIEVVIVDNGSTDNTPETLKSLLQKYPSVKTYRVKKNKGYGYGILQGLKIARGDFIGWTHADLQTNPQDILQVLKIIEKEKKDNLFIKGKRYGRNFSDILFTVGMSAFNTIFLGTCLSDINAQPNIFPKKFFESWQNPPYDFSLDLYAYYLAKKSGLDIKRIPVYFGKRIAGEAHLKNLSSKLRYSFQSLKYSFSIKNKVS